MTFCHSIIIVEMIRTAGFIIIIIIITTIITIITTTTMISQNDDEEKCVDGDLFCDHISGSYLIRVIFG